MSDNTVTVTLTPSEMQAVEEFRAERKREEMRLDVYRAIVRGALEYAISGGDLSLDAISAWEAAADAAYAADILAMLRIARDAAWRVAP